MTHLFRKNFVREREHLVVKLTNKMLRNLYKSRFLFSSNYSTKVGILGVPFEEGQKRNGVAQGPKAIRDVGLVEQLKSIQPGMDVKDYGDVNYVVDELIFKKHKTVHNVDMEKFAHMASCNAEVSNRVQEIIKDNRFCITLGGDHSIGSIDGHLKTTENNNICVLWVDAHADCNTNQTSGSGNIHGMPLALLAKELADYWPYLPGMDWQKPIISLRNVAYIGLRSVDAYERLVIEQFGINAFGMEYIEEYGISAVVKMALERIDPRRDRSIHLSFDIDALDALEAPSTGTAVRGGLTLREGVHLVEAVYNTGRLKAMDLVEVNPQIGTSTDVRHTVDAAIHILQAGCGYQRRGVEPYRDTNVPLPPPGSTSNFMNQ